MGSYLIVGVTGQDGSLIARRLIELGHKVFGTVRTENLSASWRLEALGILENLHPVEYVVGDAVKLEIAMEASQPDAVFFTAGLSHTADSWGRSSQMMRTNIGGTAESLEVLDRRFPETPAVFFGSSEVFGYSDTRNQTVTETSPHRPANPYGVSKSAASQLITLYRETRDLPVYEAVLFPHESPLRDQKFLVPKVAKAVARHRDLLGLDHLPRFGSLSSSRDWGSAEDYMDLVIEMVEHAPPDTYLIGSGRSTSVEEVFQMAFRAFGEALSVGDGNENAELFCSCREGPFAAANALALSNAGHGAVADTSKLTQFLELPDASGLEHVMLTLLNQYNLGGPHW